MEDLRILNIREVNVFLFGERIYSGKPVNLPDKFNLDVSSVTRHPRQNIVDVVLDYDLRDTKTPKENKEPKETEVKEEIEMSNLEKLKSFLAVKIDDIDDCRETLEVFGCLDSSPNIKSKVTDYLNGKQDGFLEVLEFLVSKDI